MQFGKTNWLFLSCRFYFFSLPSKPHPFKYCKLNDISSCRKICWRLKICCMGGRKGGWKKTWLREKSRWQQKNLTFGNLFIQMWMLEGKFAFSSDSVQYIKRLTNRGCVFYALHKLESWVQLLCAECVLTAQKELRHAFRRTNSAPRLHFCMCSQFQNDLNL